jgi:hypothetical protein
MAHRNLLYAGILAVLALALAGCGSSSNNAATSASASAAQGAAASAALSSRVLRAQELAGFTPSGQPIVGTSAKSWVEGLGIPPENQPSELERLEKEGLVAGELEQLAPAHAGAARGLSVVQDFNSPAAAAFELTNQGKQLQNLGAKTFAVSAIPGAHGYSQRSRISVEFADGTYYYLVGARWPHGTPSPTTTAAVIAAAQRLYRRNHG